jgi:hypothetical protein
VLRHDPVDVVGVGAAADEGEGNHVRPDAQCPAQVCDVFVGERGDADGDTGEIESLMVGDQAAFDDHAVDTGSFDIGHLQRHSAVVDQDPFAAADIGGKTLVRGTAHGAVALDVVRGDHERVTAFKEDGALREGVEADLGALQVDEDADAASGLVGGLADAAVALLVLRVGAMAEIESGHIHAGLDQCLDLVVGVGGGSEGTDDFCSAHNPSVGITVR